MSGPKVSELMRDRFFSPAENYRPWGDDEETKQAFSAMFTVASHTPSTEDYKEFSEKVGDK